MFCISVVKIIFGRWQIKALADPAARSIWIEDQKPVIKRMYPDTYAG
jgi:hypothetical protein